MNKQNYLEKEEQKHKLINNNIWVNEELKQGNQQEEQEGQKNKLKDINDFRKELQELQKMGN